MSVDYDLIVIGGAPVGRYAALRASQLGARVALVGAANLAPASLLLQALAETNTALRHSLGLPQLRLSPFGSRQNNQNLATPTVETREALPKEIAWLHIREWVQALSETLTISTATDSLVKLATAGVEVIQAEGAFERRSVHRRPVLGLTVAERWLRSRAYILASTAQATAPGIAGLSAVEFVTLDSLWGSWQTLPRDLVILGVDPSAIALAQVLNRLGVQVTIMTSGELLPQHDPELAFLLQAHLEAEGVTILTQISVTQVRQIEQQIWVQAGDLVIETEAILLATKPQLALAKLDLETAGVTWQPEHIPVNRKLQTSNPRIYACGDLSTQSAAVDRHEADVAIANALFLPFKQVNYRSMPIAVSTDPPLVSLGLTELQAQSRYGEDLLVVRQPYRSLLKAQLGGDTTGLLKLISRRNGELIGAHCFGADAHEWISIFALAIQQRLKLQALAQLPTLSPTSVDLLRQCASQFQQQQRSQRQRDWLETWFNFCRSR